MTEAGDPHSFSTEITELEIQKELKLEISSLSARLPALPQDSLYNDMGSIDADTLLGRVKPAEYWDLKRSSHANLYS